MYLDVLSPIQRLSVGEQKEEHEPIKTVKRIKDFSTTMNKLETFTDSSLNDDQGTNKIHITHFNKVVSEVSTDEEGNYAYQGIAIKQYEDIKAVVPAAYKKVIGGILKSVSERFKDLEQHPGFRHLIIILDYPK